MMRNTLLRLGKYCGTISGLWEFLGIYHEYVCDIPTVTEKTEHTYEQLPSDEKHSAKIR